MFKQEPGLFFFFLLDHSELAQSPHLAAGFCYLHVSSLCWKWLIFLRAGSRVSAEALHSPQAMGTASLKGNTDYQQKRGFTEGHVKAQ